MVEGVHCGGCIRRIEGTLTRREGVESARLNLSTRRLAIAWRGEATRAGEMAAVVTGQGYRVVPFDPGRLSALDARRETELLRCLAVAGFAAANVMLLSVSVWAGHAQGMGPATRGAAALVLRPDRDAGDRLCRAAVLRLGADGAPGRTDQHGRADLDRCCPRHRDEPVRDHPGWAARLFRQCRQPAVLPPDRPLPGQPGARPRPLRSRAPSALRAAAVTVLDAEGRRTMRPVEQVRPGMTVLVAAGERVGVDGRVVAGISTLDVSLITGETLPARAAGGDHVFAGTLNLEAPLRLEALAVGEDTAARRDRAADGAVRAAPRPLCRHRRPRGPALCAGGPQPGAGDFPRLDRCRGGRLAGGAAARRGGAHHHLPLRARARRPSGAGDRQRPAHVPGRAAQVADGARTAGPDRHRGARQDRHAHRGPTGPCQSGSCAAGGAGARRWPRRRQPASARARGLSGRTRRTGGARRAGGAGLRPGAGHARRRGAPRPPRLGERD